MMNPSTKNHPIDPGSANEFSTIQTQAKLAEPLVLRDLTIRNRIWMSPMCQYWAASSGAEQGAPHDWHLVHLGSRAVGGAGLVFTEATSVSPEGRISSHDLGLWNEHQARAFDKVATFVREQGARVGIQLTHAGRKASVGAPWGQRGTIVRDRGGWETVGPSEDAFTGYAPPRLMTKRDIRSVIHAFAAATERATRAGFDVVEIHGAHGYLLHQFLSPISNTRTDEYGGPLKNRMRLASQVVDAVRASWPAHLPLMFRVSATDWVKETGDTKRTGWGIEETVELAAELHSAGVDLVDVSSGGNVGDVRIPVSPSYQVPFARRIREEAGVPVAAVGLITEAAQAEEVLRSGSADAVLLGREMLRNPYFARDALAQLHSSMPWYPPYERATR